MEKSGCRKRDLFVKQFQIYWNKGSYVWTKSQRDQIHTGVTCLRTILLKALNRTAETFVVSTVWQFVFATCKRNRTERERYLYFICQCTSCYLSEFATRTFLVKKKIDVIKNILSLPEAILLTLSSDYIYCDQLKLSLNIRNIQWYHRLHRESKICLFSLFAFFNTAKIWLPSHLKLSFKTIKLQLLILHL